MIFKGFVTGELGEPQKVESGNGVRGGLRAIIIFFKAQENARVVGCGIVVATVFGIGKEGVLSLLKAEGPPEKAEIE